MNKIIKSLLIVGGCALALGLCTGSAGAAEVTLESVTGLWGSSTDSVAADQTIKFYLRVDNSGGVSVPALSNGFRIYSPDGASFGTVTGEWNTSVNWSSYFGGGGVLVNLEHADRVGFGALTGGMFGSGMPAGFANTAWIITLDPIDVAYHGLTLCMDSAFFDPGGYWEWANSSAVILDGPDWDGPHCFTIVAPPASCCGQYTGGYTGNCNCSTDGLITLNDITQLINHVYITKEALCCNENGNTNGSTDGLITLNDITALINKVYITKEDVAACP
jgi:hypothetical protein